MWERHDLCVLERVFVFVFFWSVCLWCSVSALVTVHSSKDVDAQRRFLFFEMDAAEWRNSTICVCWSVFVRFCFFDQSKSSILALFLSLFIKFSFSRLARAVISERIGRQGRGLWAVSDLYWRGVSGEVLSEGETDRIVFTRERWWFWSICVG